MKHSGIKDQFKFRSKTFENSAKWVTDGELVAKHCRLAKPSKNDLILEACCGTGVVGGYLSRISGAKVFGADISLDMLNKAAKKLRACVNATVEKLPFADNTFDVTVCRQAFHFLDTKHAMKEIYRVLKPGKGTAVISQIVPFSGKDKEWLRKIHKIKQPLLKNFLCEEDMMSLMTEAGFVDITSCEYFIEEHVNNWLLDTNFAKKTIRDIEMMFADAPLIYKKLHKTRVSKGQIFDTMRWVIFKGRKK